MVVAQLVKQLLTTPKIRGSNPDIDKILLTYSTLDKTKIKKNRPGMAHLFKNIMGRTMRRKLVLDLIVVESPLGATIIREIQV